MKESFNAEDILGQLQHHDAITGTESQYVTFDYEFRLGQSFKSSKEMYLQKLADMVQSQGLNVTALYACRELTQNETVTHCPIYEK